MRIRTSISWLVVILIFGSGGAYIAKRNKALEVTDDQSTKTPEPVIGSPVASSPLPSVTPQPASASPTDTVEEKAPPPIDQFFERITKKFFGTYVTPENSPVQPERFSGYHTGVDVEYGDVSSDVEVRAVADGIIMYASTASGYGGVTIIRHTLQGKNVAVVYGHLDPISMLAKDRRVKKGEVIGRLGEGGTKETDGERKHLHFGIIRNPEVNLKGYVQSKAELAAWYDPLDFIQKNPAP